MVYSLFQLASTGNWRASTVPSRGLGRGAGEGGERAREGGGSCDARLRFQGGRAAAAELWVAERLPPGQLVLFRMRGRVPIGAWAAGRRARH